ncbi:MAG: DNA modification methylase [Pseudomonadales bacterium]|nr:DNA modification methylase [Pseudomonadales bacterium]
MRQLTLFPKHVLESEVADGATGTFTPNMKLPVHRWFRFSAGFSAQWCESVIREQGKDVHVLDPFAGSATTLIAAEVSNVSAMGIEAHPFLTQIANAKLQYRQNPDSYLDYAEGMLQQAKAKRGETIDYPELITRCYSSESLRKLDSLRQVIIDRKTKTFEWQLTWLTLISILRSTSSVGTAQWQYILPGKSKKAVLDPFVAYQVATNVVYDDMQWAQAIQGPKSRLLQSDARTCAGAEDNWANFVLTSPPYPNNYDYADATRLELCFLRELDGWGDLQEKVRRFLIRACSQHVPPSSVDLQEVLNSDELEIIRDEITEICKQLTELRMLRKGKKTYNLMIACYFLDMAKVWLALRRVCKSPSRCCFVIGDSAPYGVYVPVIEWLGKLALAAGFETWEFEKIRDRNVKWKNRKHRIPLCEGRLWVKG